MPWKSITLDSLIEAMNESDRMGHIEFTKKYNFDMPKSFYMSYGGGEYVARALIAAAYLIQNKNAQPLTSSSFKNNDGHDFLRQYGFSKKKIGS